MQMGMRQRISEHTRHLEECLVMKMKKISCTNVCTSRVVGCLYKNGWPRRPLQQAMTRMDG